MLLMFLIIGTHGVNVSCKCYGSSFWADGRFSIVHIVCISFLISSVDWGCRNEVVEYKGKYSWPKLDAVSHCAVDQGNNFISVGRRSRREHATDYLMMWSKVAFLPACCFWMWSSVARAFVWSMAINTVRVISLCWIEFAATFWVDGHTTEVVEVLVVCGG